jgi:STE24 endopeptidase
MKDFFMDILKSLIFSIILGGPLLSIFLHLIKWGGENFYLYIFFFFIFVQIFLILVYPTFIEPWFNEVKPLEEGDLKNGENNLFNKF